jgi:hypothetical protein
VRVDWAILCRYVEVNNGLATVIGGGIDRYTVPQLPAQLGLTIALRLVGLPDMAEHTLQVEVFDPSMNPAGQPLPTAKLRQSALGPDHPAGWEVNVIVPTQVRLEVTEYGTYTVSIKVDGQAHTMAFRVNPPPPT